MSNFPQITKMASGNLSLLITEDVSYEDFPEQANRFVKEHNAYVLKKIETPVDRMWIVLIKWRPFFLAFDDYPLSMSLDSMSCLCNSVIRQLYTKMGGKP